MTFRIVERIWACIRMRGTYVLCGATNKISMMDATLSCCFVIQTKYRQFTLRCAWVRTLQTQTIATTTIQNVYLHVYGISYNMVVI
jgi:hypothetical protein